MPLPSNLHLMDSKALTSLWQNSPELRVALDVFVTSDSYRLARALMVRMAQPREVNLGDPNVIGTAAMAYQRTAAFYAVLDELERLGTLEVFEPAPEKGPWEHLGL